MEYEKIIESVRQFLTGEASTENCKKFTEYYMDSFYELSDILENEVSKRRFYILDDMNLICDSYEPNSDIRSHDKHCIDEDELKKRILNTYEQLLG